MPSAPKEHGRPEQALINNPFILTPPATPTIGPPSVPPSPLLARIWAGVLRVLTSAPAMTAALVLMPTNSKDDPGYKSEWDLGRLMQPPTDKDRARLAYLEAEREHRALSNEEQDELVSLLALVRKVHLGSPTSLGAYYEQRHANIALAAKLKKPSDAHSVNTIRGNTEWGGGDRYTPKTVAMGHVDLTADFAAIQAGDAAYDKQTHTFTTKLGRVYGFHSDRIGQGKTSAIYPIRGNPGDFVNLTQAEFDVLKTMSVHGGLTGGARQNLEGKMRTGNKGLGPDSEAKLTTLYNSKKK